LALIAARTARTGAERAEATTALDRADRLLPHSPQIPYARGLLLMGLHRYPEAVGCFRQAAERSPNNTDALYNLSRALEFAGRAEESRAAGRRFVEARDYLRQVTHLTLQAQRDSTNDALWRRVAELAEAHGDAGRARAA